MTHDKCLAVFEDFKVVDIVAALLQQPYYQAARKYWKVLKGRLAKEGSQLVSDCYQLKMEAEHGHEEGSANEHEHTRKQRNQNRAWPSLWYFSVIDVVRALTDSANARDYWFKMKLRVKTEAGVELSTFCRQLKLPSADGKNDATDCANAEGLLRIIQSIPSPKAEPFKQWLAKVGYERIQDMSDPARSLDRAREYWRQHGRSEKWIQQRMMGQETRNKLTDYCAQEPRCGADR